LYDHTLPEKETKNMAEEQPEVVSSLKQLLEAKMSGK
jgi:hypothetical protein